ncbi:hypothetical protein SDC9_68297 [bioreactor metagenome]|uniref:Uncharacterized protein n=1 Tax=bioreactor metagenome TaxID=1076179 RepID=A0A644Y142_9ZZZZ
MAQGHEIVHFVGGQRCDEVNAGVPGKISARGLLHHRRQVDRIDQLGIGESIGNPAQGGHDVFHGPAVVFPPVAGDEDHFFALVIQFL